MNEPKEEPRRIRELAKRARHMATWLSSQSDKTNMKRYADELERRAAELERQSLVQAQPVTHEQQ